MVVEARHGGGDGSTYVVEMVALCGGVDIMDIDDLGGWLRGWYVVEDDNKFRWRRM